MSSSRHEHNLKSNGKSLEILYYGKRWMLGSLIQLATQGIETQLHIVSDCVIEDDPEPKTVIVSWWSYGRRLAVKDTSFSVDRVDIQEKTSLEGEFIHRSDLWAGFRASRGSLFHFIFYFLSLNLKQSLHLFQRWLHIIIVNIWFSLDFRMAFPVINRQKIGFQTAAVMSLR